ncbi:DsbA family protein [Streptomyces sp. NPDC029216]|uniref:DsbA family protein n=1 Tax=Streptomyces sp. NPDC029216 TaxID=3154701 RepID=UPI0033D8A31D
MHIEVWADTTCPWCFLGRHRLHRALDLWEAEGRERPEVIWLPYQVDPLAPRTAVPRDEETARRRAELHDAGTRDSFLAELAEAEGPGFAWRPRWRVNTFEALARRHGGNVLQDAVKSELLRAHFVRGENLGDPAVLVAAAEAAGFSRAGEALAAGEGGAQVRAESARGAADGITAAPTIVVGRRALAGAQDPEVILGFLRDAAEVLRTEPGLAAEQPPGAVPADPLVRDPVETFRSADRLLRAREPLEALRVLRSLPGEYAQDSAVLLLTARCCFATAQLGRAEGLLRRIVEADPADDYAQFMLGRCLLRQSRQEDARVHLRIAAALNPDPEYVGVLAQAGV